jgi:hypothetical protein
MHRIVANWIAKLGRPGKPPAFNPEPTDAVDAAEEYKELCTSLRYYGSIRLTLLPLFLAFNGLLAQLFAGDKPIMEQFFILTLPVAGVVMNCFALHAEWILDDGVTLWRDRVTQIYERSHWNLSEIRRNRITYWIRIIYASLLGFWLCVFIRTWMFGRVLAEQGGEHTG